MLLFDLIYMKNLKSYMESSLKQIESCLEKNMHKFMNSSQFSQIQLMGKHSEMEFKEWNDNFGYQVKATFERKALLEEETQKLKNQETTQIVEIQKTPKKQNEWSNNLETLNNSNLSKKKKQRKKKTKNKFSKGGLIRWTEAESDSKNNLKDCSSKWNTETSHNQSVLFSNEINSSGLMNFSK